MAKNYYDQLYKTYALADLTKYETKQLGNSLKSNLFRISF